MLIDAVPFLSGAVLTLLAAALLIRASPPLGWCCVIVLALQCAAVYSRSRSPDWPLPASVQGYLYLATPLLMAAIALYVYLRLPYKLFWEWLGAASAALASACFLITAAQALWWSTD